VNASRPGFGAAFALLAAFSATSATVVAQAETRQGDPTPATRPSDLGAESAPARRRGLTSFEAGFAHLVRYEDGETALALIDDVRLQAGDLFIRAENVLVWIPDSAREAAAGALRAGASREGEGEPSENRDFVKVPDAVRLYAREIYADGVVVVMQGDEITRADAAYFDLERDRGLIVDARASFEFPSREGASRLYIRADEMRLLALDRFEAVGVRATTCSFGHPHFHVSSDAVEIWRARKGAPRRPRRVRGEGLEDRPPSTASGIRYTASGNVLRMGETPVFWLPDVSGEGGSAAGGTTRNIRDIRVGSNSEFGRRLGVTFGDDLVDENGDIWAEWGVLLDYRSKRGFGGGVDFAYDRQDYLGFAHLYYQRDHGVDRLFGPPKDDDRGRVSLRHRHMLPWEMQLDLELNDFSDRNFYRTYYEDEAKTDKPPETYAYLKRAFDRGAATLLFSQRLDSFETLTEYRPKADVELVYEPIFELLDTPVYFSARAEAARLRRRVDDAVATPGARTDRVDAEVRFEAPIEVGPITATPFVGMRSTYYGEDLFGRDDRLRDGFTYGVELASQAWKTFDAQGGIFGLDGIRHVVRPSVEYRRTTGVDLTPTELYRYDATDAFADREEVVFEVRNLFQTVRRREEGPAVDEFLDLEFSISFFPDADRDNGGDPFGPLRGDHVVRFNDQLQFLSDFELDLRDGKFIVFDAAVGYAPTRDLQLLAGVRNYDETYGLVFAQTNWRISEKWLARLYGSYDYERGESSDYELGLVRIGHDFVFELYLAFDFGDDDKSINFALTPRAWFNPVVDPARRFGSEPRLSTLRERLYR
jgi:hypothetical protein